MEGLRQRAEKIHKRKASEPNRLSQEETQRLIHELEVHQIELELQNEELRRLHLEAEESRNRFSDLYDFAPVGYLTVDETGQVTGANLTSAEMLGVKRDELIGTRMENFAVEEDRDFFYLQLRMILNTNIPLHFEARIKRRENDSQFHGHLECRPVSADGGNATRIRITVTDITERKQTEEQLKQSMGGKRVPHKGNPPPDEEQYGQYYQPAPVAMRRH